MGSIFRGARRRGDLDTTELQAVIRSTVKHVLVRHDVPGSPKPDFSKTFSKGYGFHLGTFAAFLGEVQTALK